LWQASGLENGRPQAHIRRMMRAAIFLGVLFAGTAAFLFRFDVSAIAGKSGAPDIYRLDRWTGSVVLCQVSAVAPSNVDCKP
jgi:hypothetical protein